MTANENRRQRRPAVLLEDVSISYPGAAPTLAGVDLRVNAGEFVSVVGSSGAGKSTLLRLLTGQLHPSSGRALIAGFDLADMTPGRTPMLRRRIGVTFQDAKLLPGRTAAQNISYALELTGVRSATARARAIEVLEQVEVAHLADRMPPQMSGGEAQRVGIARALAGNPYVLLCDEPTGNLDPDTTVGIIDILAAVADAGTAVVMVTHDVAAIDRLTRRVIRISDGTITSDQAHATYADTTEIPIITDDMLDVADTARRRTLLPRTMPLRRKATR